MRSSTASSNCAGGHKSSRSLYSLLLRLQHCTCILSVGADLLNPINDIIVPQRQLGFRLLSRVLVTAFFEGLAFYFFHFLLSLLDINCTS